MLPQYEITGIIGRGGMGAVYKAQQTNLRRTVAIKLLPESLSQGDDELNFAARFKLEAKAMAKLSHPAIITVYGFGETSEGQLYFVMEFIDGMDIQGYLKEHGGILSQENALTITAHVLDALEYAHNKGIIHRDIKPANIMLNREGQVKIADFGLAKALSIDEDDSVAALTMSNVALGTPDFVAPEALDYHGNPDHRADLYAVGVMLYRMLTGKLPRGNFDLPSEIQSELDPRLDGVISRSMEADPDNRYSSASELRLALDPVITSPMSRKQMAKNEETAMLATKSADKASSPKKSITIAVAALVMVGGLVAFLMNSGDKQDKADTPVVAVAKTPPEKKPVPPVAKASVPPVTEKPKATTPAKPAEPMVKKAEATVAKAKPTADSPKKEAVKAAPSPAELKQQQKQAELLAIPGLKTRLTGYLKAQSTQVGNLATKYMSGLDAQLNQAANAGDTKLVKAFREEKGLVEKLQKTLSKPPTNPVAEVEEEATLTDLAASAPKDLAGLRKIWTAERQKIRNTLDLALRKSLSGLEKQLTKSRDHKNAEKVLAYQETFTKATPPIEVAMKPATPKKTPATSSGNTSMAVKTATKDKPYENSLGMKFVPVPITGGATDGKRVLFSIWETRVKDYEKFIKRNKEREWPKPDFKQEEEHPAVNVSWEGAVAFCEWLTEEDRKKGKLGKDEHYRLPTDHEWTCAVGLGREEDADAIPSAKNDKIADIYPWGKKFPPPKGAGNYYGEETKRNPVSDTTRMPIEGYDDSFDRTASVGSFEANEYGVYDMGGNVWEWCEDWLNPDNKEKRVLRGASWDRNEEVILRSSRRFGGTPTARVYYYGFRVLVAGGGG